MKALLIALLVSLTAVTASARDSGTFSCLGLEGDIHVTLKPLAQKTSDVQEGTKVPYLLELNNNGFQTFSGAVMASQKDVMFQYSGEDTNLGLSVSGTIYLDELDQSTISFGGAPSFQVNCGQR